MVNGPEVAQIIQESEKSLDRSPVEKELTEHHEQNDAFQEDFTSDVTKLVGLIMETGIHLRRGLLTSLLCKAPDAMKNMLTNGVQQYETFVRERLLEKIKKFSEPIKQNNIMLIAGTKRKIKGTRVLRVSSLKRDRHLFSRLYIACQTRRT